MVIHNIIEDIVFGSIDNIFQSMQKEGNPENFCFCEQCRLDTACYVLNRCQPHYILSNRGVARLEQKSLQWQQLEADIASLIHDGLKRVKHNQRPNTSHDDSVTVNEDEPRPVYNIPVIMGRIFDGATFAPLSGVQVELRWNGSLVSMRDQNWQNPYVLVANTAGAFTFWPAAVNASASDNHKIFEYLIKIEHPEYETLTHFFKIPVVSKIQKSVSFSIDRTFKLPDLYMFPPDDSGQDD
ncbi:MAG TPA: competence protein ComFB [Treponema sp.]|nr:competence protein ComFB [Treponema sp.]